MSKDFDLSKLTDVEQAVLKKIAKKFSSEDTRSAPVAKTRTQKEDRVMMGQLLKRIRENHKLSQREVGIRLGLENPNFVSNIEKGKAAPPRDKVFKFALAYDTDVKLNYALLKFTLHDWWELWLESQAHLSEMGWPDPYTFEQEIVSWVEQQFG